MTVQGEGAGARGLTYTSLVSVALLLSASESAAAPASPIWLSHRLQGSEERRVRDARGETLIGTAQHSTAQHSTAQCRAGRARLDLLELRQRRIAPERLRERRGARIADSVVPQAAASTSRGG